jgi:hypothetical protein
MQEHYQPGGGSLQAISWEDDQAPWEVEGDDRLKNVYEANAPIILLIGRFLQNKTKRIIHGNEIFKSHTVF